MMILHKFTRLFYAAEGLQRTGVDLFGKLCSARKEQKMGIAWKYETAML